MAVAFVGPSAFAGPSSAASSAAQALHSPRTHSGCSAASRAPLGLGLGPSASTHRAAAADAGGAGPTAAGRGALAAATSAALLASRRPRRRRGGAAARRAVETKHVSQEVLKLTELGGSPSAKALNVNLDPTLYGSFAEIGAGQEVSRTFLTAGAAAGTVARSLSAYDMQLSDATYGQAKRYVTQERVRQMLETEYSVLEQTIRETKGPETRFFAFATTLAAKAYMSNRECEGWVGLTFQHEAGAERSTVMLHVRMCDDTAPKQGEAIGFLGTNLIYLCNTVSDPYLISSFLLDGIAAGRLEIDYVDFSGPKWPAGSVDMRLLAMRMVQFRVAVSVLLDYDAETGRYQQVVPNTALYKRSLVVQRSRFRPVTYAHQEVMKAASRQLDAEQDPDAKPAMNILNLQIDDIVRPAGLVKTEGRLERTRKLAEADTDGDGMLTLDELRELVSDRMAEDDVEVLLKEVDVEGTGKVEVDALLSMSPGSILVTEFLDRFNMVEPLKFPVLVSGVRRTHKLAQYLARYTKMPIAIVIGGGNYNIQRALFDKAAYKVEQGGMLAAFGRLFAQNVRLFQYPNITPEGDVVPIVLSDDPASLLHSYFIEEGSIVVVKEQHMSPEAADKATNLPFRGQSEDVMRLISEGSSEWEQYVPKEVTEIVRKRSWFSRLSSGKGMARSLYEILNEL